VVPLEDGFLFAVGASLLLTVLGEGRSGQDPEGVAACFLYDCVLNLGMREVMATFGTLQHPSWHASLTSRSDRMFGWVKGRQAVKGK
jgi:hypothetical protein